MSKYGIIAKTFHWLMAIMVIAMLALGLYMEDLKLGPDKLQLYGWHKSTGITILVLVSLRLWWRLLNPPPQLPDDMVFFQKLAAHLSHVLLYSLMIFMPLVGWLMSSAADFPVSVFGWFTLPALIDADPEYVRLFKAMHYYGGRTLIILICAHVFAALYHHFIRKDDILKRMLPW